MESITPQKDTPLAPLVTVASKEEVAQILALGNTGGVKRKLGKWEHGGEKRQRGNGAAAKGTAHCLQKGGRVVECHYCHKQGHVKAVCRKHLADEKARKEKLPKEEAKE